MNFATLKEWNTPRGKVKELAIDGVTVWKNAETLGGLAVGSSVFMNVNGVRTEFLVVHQGLPSSDYDNSCDGTWLLVHDIYFKFSWNGTLYNSYAGSTIHTRLNGTNFFNKLDSNIQSLVKTVKIPYTNVASSTHSLVTGSSGLSTQVFLLSHAEVGFPAYEYAYAEGAVLDYFRGADDSQRIASFDGANLSWYLRTPYTKSTQSALCVTESGARSAQGATVHIGIRPALILPSDALVDGEFNVIA